MMIVLYKYRYYVIYNVVRRINTWYNRYKKYKEEGLKRVGVKSIRDDLHIHILKYNGKEVNIFHKDKNHKFEHGKIVEELSKNKQNNYMMCYFEINDGIYDLTSYINKFKYDFNKETELVYFIEYVVKDNDINMKNIKRFVLIDNNLDKMVYLIEQMTYQPIFIKLYRME